METEGIRWVTGGSAGQPTLLPVTPVAARLLGPPGQPVPGPTGSPGGST